MPAEVTRYGVLDMQVCVPAEWPDEQVVNFASQKYPCGTTTGWFIRRQGDKGLGGDDERVPCAERAEHVHITLDA